MVKLVPSKTGGASRRAYNRAYAKSASGKESNLLGKLKLRSDPIKPSKVPGGGASFTRRDYKLNTPEFNADFGTTGFTKEEFNE